MRDRYLLYLDILGFAELARGDARRVHDLYQVIASLRGHKHGDFQTIVFSDTLLIYNVAEPRSDSDKAYLVMYLCEFVQDLQHRLVGRDISFRALLVRGDFEHYKRGEVPCFFGPALIKAYTDEKNIPATGLFIDGHCNSRNEIFRTLPLDDTYSFVFLTQNLTELEDTWQGQLPLDDIVAIESDMASHLGPEVMHLERIYRLAHSVSDARIRAKYAFTWTFYEKRYPKTCRSLLKEGFALEAINAHFDWQELRAQYPEDFSTATSVHRYRPR